VKCRKCGGETKVLETRTPRPFMTRRRRQCIECGARVTTEERVLRKKVKEAPHPVTAGR
jgi:transcriptional regulator NrdR family protein